MIRLDTTGRNRVVLLTARHAIKLPSPRGWRDFLFGLLNNLNERDWHREHDGFCPVIWAAPLGLALVMPRARVLTDAEHDHLQAAMPALPGVECKASSWGWLAGRLVALDYGWR